MRQRRHRIARVRERAAWGRGQSTVYSLSRDARCYVRAYVASPTGRIAPGTPVRGFTDIGEPIAAGRFVLAPRRVQPKTVETTDLRTDLVYRLRVVVDDGTSAAPGMP